MKFIINFSFLLERYIIFLHNFILIKVIISWNISEEINKVIIFLKIINFSKFSKCDAYVDTIYLYHEQDQNREHICDIWYSIIYKGVFIRTCTIFLRLRVGLNFLTIVFVIGNCRLFWDKCHVHQIFCGSFLSYHSKSLTYWTDNSSPLMPIELKMFGLSWNIKLEEKI